MRAGTNRLQLTLDGRRWKYHHGRKSQGGDRTVGGRLGCLRSHDGKRIAVLFSHAAHPVIVHWVSEAITTDVPGYAVGHLRNLLDKYSNPQGVLMFAQGCCANINGYPLRGGYDAADAAGLSLVFAKKNALAHAETVSAKSFKASALDVSLPHWHPSVKACRKMLEQEPDSRHRERLQRIISGVSQEFLSFPMSAFSIGDELCFVFLPSEAFAEYQLLADETSPFKPPWS